MASKWPAVKNSAYVFRCVLFAQSDNQIKSNPSLSSGDWKVSIDGGAFANLATLPDVDPDSSVQVKVSLSADEMNGDEIMVTAIDAAGAEWHSAAFVIHTAGQTFDALKALIDDLESRLTATRAGYLDNLSGGAAALEATAQSILTDTGTTLDALLQDIPTTAELATALASADDAVLAAIAALNNLSSAGAQAAAAAALTAYGAATATNVTNATSLLALEATVAALNNIDVVAIITALETKTLPDSYSADGAQPTYAQALLEIRQFLMERGVINTTLTVNKPDGTTPAFTLALDDDANPTSISRVS
jgi:hypothetical protein